jgi:adenylosuccinate synthase
MDENQLQHILTETAPAGLIDAQKYSLSNPPENFRPNVIAVEDAFFGDSGKGAVTAKFNALLNQDRNLLSIRFNGGANAGHETYLHGKLIVTHQLPTGIICPGATALISRAMVIHPEDLLFELDTIRSQFNNALPARLVIDDRVVLSLDTHRALESALNDLSTGGHGATKRGIATAYASYYLRIPVMLRDLLSDDWENILRGHYRLFDALIAGFPDRSLASTHVTTMSAEIGKTRPVGDVNTFIQRLAQARERIRPFASSQVYQLLQNAWEDPSVPITFEGAQGAGLDPYHGVYPDVTASRPMSHNINDATYNIIRAEDIYYRVAVLKATYMSSVGTRRLPADQDASTEQWIQQAFDEKGRSTGRMRDIYPISIPIAQYLRRAAGYRFVIATHLDASRTDTPINVITRYTDHISGAELPYLPYQDHLDRLSAHTHTFDGWDGQAVKSINNVDDLPHAAQRYIHFLSHAIAPLVMVTTGPDIEDYIKWNI